MNKKKLLALLMALVMTLSLVPVTAFAVEGGGEDAINPPILNPSFPNPSVVNVAQIGQVGYATLAEAIAAANDGDTVKLLADVSITDVTAAGRIIINKSITLDLDSNKIAFAENAVCGDNFAVLWVQNDATLTLTGNGTIDGISAEAYGINVGLTQKSDRAESAGHVIIKNGTVKGDCSAIQIQYGDVTIEDGYFEVNPYNDGKDPYRYTLNAIDAYYSAGKATYAVKGGSFFKFDPSDSASENPKGNFVADGYKAVDNGDDTWTVSAKTYVAQVYSNNEAGTKYETLDAAVAAAQDGDTIVLLANIEYNTTSNLNITKSVTIDGQGTYSVSGGMEGGTAGTGSKQQYGPIVIWPNETVDSVTLQNLTIVKTGGNSAFLTAGANNTYLTDVSVTAQSATGIYSADGITTLVNCNVTNTGENSGASFRNSALQASGGSELVIKSGNYQSDDMVMNTLTSGGLITVEGGTFSGKIYVYNTTDNYWNTYGQGVVTIKGGTFNNVSFELAGGTHPGKIVITGGTFDADPTNYVAAGYEAVKNGNGTWTVVSANTAVAQIGDVKYATLDAAIADANSGATIELLADITGSAATQMNGNNYDVVITKSLTLNGNNHSITSNNARTIGIMGVDADHMIDVTINNLTINNSKGAGRGIYTYGNLSSLTLSGVNLNLTGTTGYIQPLTISGEQTTALNITITGGTISTSADGDVGYAITTFVPVNMTVSGSTIKGWACLNCKGITNPSPGSKGSSFEFSNCTLLSTNTQSGPTNAYSMFTIEDDDVTLDVSGSNMTVTGVAQWQSVVCFSYNPSVTGTPVANNVTVTFGDGNTIAMAGNALLEKVGHNTYSYETWNNKFYITGTQTVTYNGEAAQLTDRIPDTFTPAEDNTGDTNYAALGPKDVYYYWENGSGYTGVYCSLEDVFDPNQSAIGDGEFVRFLQDVSLTQNSTCAMYGGATGTLNVTLGEYSVTKGNYSVTLAVGTSVKTDKQVDIFSAPSGYKVVETANDDDSFTYSVEEVTYVAQIGEGENATQYETLQAAIDAAQSGDTITLLQNNDLGTTGVTIAAGKIVTLDLAGYDISGAVNGKLITNNGDLTIYGDGHIYNTDISAQGHDAVCNYGVLTINGGTFGDSDDVMTNGNNYNRGAGVRNLGGTVTINGGNFTAGDNYLNSGWAYAIINGDGEKNGTITINDAVVYGQNNGNLAANDGSIIVNGGTFSITGQQSYYCLYAEVGASISVSGGSFIKTSGSSNVLAYKSGNIAITGGLYNKMPERVAPGYEAVVLTNTNKLEGETEGWYKVGEIATTEVEKQESANTGYEETYSAKRTVTVSDVNQTLSTGDSITVNVKATNNEVAEVGSAAAMYDLDSVVASAVKEAATNTEATLNVEIAVVSTDVSADTSSAVPTVTYEVHPEATIKSGETAIGSFIVTNDQLAENASFTIKLFVPEALRNDNRLINVTHKKENNETETFENLQYDNDFYVTIANITSFSEFELTPVATSGDGITVMQSLDLASQISINLYVKSNTSASIADYTITYTRENGNPVSKKLSETTLLSSGYYKIVIGTFDAKQMTETVNVTIRDGNDYIVFTRDNYSIQSYCNSVIGASSGTYGEKLVNLCKATLEYGTYSQRYFNYKLDNLAHEGNNYYTLGNIDSSYAGTNGSLTGVSASMALNLESQVQLIFYFKPLSSETLTIEEVTSNNAAFTGWKWTKSQLDSGYTKVVISGIPSGRLNEKFNVKVSCGGSEDTWSWSAMSFAYAAQNHSRMNEVSRALANYYKYASEYFK